MQKTRVSPFRAGGRYPPSNPSHDTLWLRYCRYCFRIVSPEKEYTLQAESEVEQQEWMEALQVGWVGQ